MAVKRFAKPLFVFISQLLTPHGKRDAVRMEGTREAKQGTICGIEELKDRAFALVADAKASGLVVTITQHANHSHVFGKFDEYIQIRESDELLKVIQARSEPITEEGQ